MRIKFAVLLSVVLVAIGCTVMINSIAFASSWAFDFPITITDTSNTTRTYVPVLLGTSGQSLINAGYTVTGMNTAMLNGNTAVPYMMGTTQIPVVIESLPSGGQVPISLFTGYSPAQTSFPIITGQGGNVTVADSASLEHSANFTDSFTGLITDNQTLLSHMDANGGHTITTASGNATATIYLGSTSTTNVSPTSPVGTGWSNPGNAVDNNLSTYASADCSGDGFSSGHTNAIVMDTNDSISSSAVLVDCTTTVSGGAGMRVTIAVNYSNSWHTITSFTGITPGTLTSFAIGSNQFVSQISVVLHGNYNGSCTAWLYEVYAVQENMVSVSASYGLSSNQTITVIEDSSNFWITTAAGSSSNTTAVSIPNISTNYTIGVNVPYFTFNTTIGGVQQLSFAPNAMIQGTNIPDLSGNSNNGTINWGTNSGISIKFGQVVASNSTSYQATANGSSFQVPKIPIPSNFYGGADDSSCANLPFYGSIHAAYIAGGTPTQTVYLELFIALGLAVAVFIMMFIKSVFLGVLGMVGILYMGSQVGGGIIPGWVPVIVLITDIAVAYLYMHIGR